MKKSKWVQVWSLAKQYGIYFICWFGGTTLLDYALFEKVIDNQVIAGNLWLSPFMALSSLIIKHIQIGEETESTSGQLSGEKE